MDPFVGEIRIFGFNFPPTGWAICAGQILPISQNTALFSLLGTQYGGNGTSNFALPNFQNLGAIGQGNGNGLTPRVVGETAGASNVTLIAQQMASHTHAAKCVNDVGDSYGPAPNTVWAADAGGANEYAATENVTMNHQVLASAGGNQPHNNWQPYLVLNYCIALQGIYPPRS